MAKQEHKSMHGRSVDMEAMRARNETTVAVSNQNLNARGDQLKGGKIVKRREEVVSEYYETNPNAKPRNNPVEAAPATDAKVSETKPAVVEKKPAKPNLATSTEEGDVQ